MSEQFQHLEEKSIITACKRSLVKVMFSQVFVCPRGGLPTPPVGRPRWGDCPNPPRHTPWMQTIPGGRLPPLLHADPLNADPPDTVNKREVHILLECILVLFLLTKCDVFVTDCLVKMFLLWQSMSSSQLVFRAHTTVIQVNSIHENEL